MKAPLEVSEPTNSSEVSSRFPLVDCYLFWVFLACFNKVSKSSAWNLPLEGKESYSLFESEETEKGTS
jgi:hypothetical protein